MFFFFILSIAAVYRKGYNKSIIILYVYRKIVVLLGRGIHFFFIFLVLVVGIYLNVIFFNVDNKRKFSLCDN